MLTSVDDFNLIPYSIPNIQEVEEDGTFDLFLEREEEAILIKILGRPLAMEFLAGIAVAVDAEADPPLPLQRWVDLRDGVEYNCNGKVLYFDGLKSLMVPYIFFKWTEYTIENNSGIGVVSQNSENAEKVSPEFTLSRAYNDFAKKVGVNFGKEDSLYGYLYNSEDTYLADLSNYTSIAQYMIDYIKPVRLRNSFGL